jgi:CheY-like chemotaxis protein
VQDSAQTLLNIINDILDLERINTGNVEIEVIPFDITGKLQSTIGLFTPVAAAKSLYLTLIANFTGECIVEGDPTRFGQVLNNLIGNAIKFTHHGGVTVNAELNFKPEETVLLHISVTDTGIGIAGEALEKIFTPFTQAYPETSRIYGGTGLGLAISKNLVNLQRGRLWVESKVNIGSTFHFEIPFIKYKQQNAMSQNMNNKQGRGINRKIKILLAEDNDINQLLANKILQHLGFEAKTADNGDDAIKLLMDDDFDVILMDIQMPEKNGIETSSEIRALHNEKKRAIPIIALTANALKGEEKKYFAAGMNGYLTKPFKEKELYEAIVNVLPEEYFTPAEQPAGETGGTPVMATAPKEAKLFNLDDLKMLQKDDDTFVANIVGLFIQNVPKNAAELVMAADNGDWDRVYFLAHKMKPSIEMVNMLQLKDVVKNVELSAKTKTNLDEIPAKVAHVHAVVLKAAEQMKEEFGF